MDFNRIVFVNATFEGSAHEMIDSSLITEFAEFSNEINVYFLRSRLEVLEKAVRKLKPNHEVHFYNLYNIKRESAIKDLIGAMIEGWLLLVKSDKKTIFVCSFANRFTRYVLNFLSLLLKRKVIICAHNDLEAVSYLGKGHWWYLVNRFYTRLKWSPYLRVLVLGDNIKHNLKDYISRDRLGFFISLDHPYYSDQVDSEHSFNSKEIHIGVVGQINQNKQRGADNLLGVAKAMSNYPQVIIHVISRIHKDLIPSLSPYVHLDNKEGLFLSKDEYEQFINKMDYLYYPYPSDCFKFTASGAIFESIVNKKPALMYSNSYFKYLNQKYGRFGYFIDEFETLDKFVLMLEDEVEYRKLCNSTAQIKNKIHPKELYKSLESELIHTYDDCSLYSSLN